MYYFTNITLPDNTPLASPIRKDIKLDKGTIEYIEIEFPKGCVGLVYLSIFDKGWKIIPFSTDDWLYGDDRVFHAGINYDLDEEPYQLTVFGYNLDTRYFHSPSIAVQLSAMKDKTLTQKLLGL
jgi:hypothetical protein